MSKLRYSSLFTPVGSLAEPETVGELLVTDDADELLLELTLLARLELLLLESVLPDVEPALLEPELLPAELLPSEPLAVEPLAVELPPVALDDVPDPGAPVLPGIDPLPEGAPEAGELPDAVCP